MKKPPTKSLFLSGQNHAIDLAAVNGDGANACRPFCLVEGNEATDGANIPPTRVKRRRPTYIRRAVLNRAQHREPSEVSERRIDGAGVRSKRGSAAR